MPPTSIAGQWLLETLIQKYNQSFFREDWGVIFTLLEVVGAGASPAMPGQVGAQILPKFIPKYKE